MRMRLVMIAFVAVCDAVVGSYTLNALSKRAIEQTGRRGVVFPGSHIQHLKQACVKMGLESELGATGPLLPYWDPLGLAISRPEKFQRWRAVELKHGRIAMLATTGYIVQEILDLPGYLSPSAGLKFSDVPNGIKGLAMVPAAGLAQILVGIALMEIVTWRYYEGPWPGAVPINKSPGDVAGELWVRYSDPEERKTKLNIELNNGRAAMIGSLGMLMHDHLTGSWIPPGL